MSLCFICKQDKALQLGFVFIIAGKRANLLKLFYNNIRIERSYEKVVLKQIKRTT